MRFAVLGCGSIGRRHLRNLVALGQTDLLAFDPAPAAREAVTAELGLECFGVLEDVWAQQPDVILINTPPSTHIELALAAARHGCHLFIEKPLGDTLAGVPDLIELIRQRDLITMVGCNMRFHPGPARVKQLIDEGTVGVVLAARIQAGSYLPEWRPWQDYRQSYSAQAKQGGGATLDCIHEIDLALWYFGAGTVVGAATQRGDSLQIEVEGIAEILIRHESGVLTNLHLNFVQRDYRRCCQVIGDRGTIYWDFDHPFVEVRTTGASLPRYDLPPDWNMNQMYFDELVYFLRCLSEGEQPFCTVEDGLAALQVALAAREIGSAKAHAEHNQA